MPEKPLEQKTSTTEKPLQTLEDDRSDCIPEYNSSDWLTDSSYSDFAERMVTVKKVRVHFEEESVTDSEQANTVTIDHNKANEYGHEMRTMPSHQDGERGRLMNVKIVLGKPPKYPRHSHKNK